MSNHALISHWGHLLCYDHVNFRLVCVSLSAVETSHLPVLLCDSRPLHVFCRHEGEILILDLLSQTLERPASITSPDVSFHGPAVAFENQGWFLRCLEDGSVSFDSRAAGAWELFSLNSETKIDDLIYLSTRRWVSRFRAEIVDFHDAKLLANILVYHGGQLDLNQNYPFVDPMYGMYHADKPVELTVINDTWKVDRLVLYNPLVAFVQFGAIPEYLQLLQESLSSLAKFGDYGGDIVVLGDQNKATLERYMPPRFSQNFKLTSMKARDKLDYCLARWSLGSLQNLYQYQPIIYADTDVFFDDAIEPCLIDLLLSKAVSGQLETFNRLEEAIPSGSWLFEADNALVKDQFGFCAGLFGVPNFQDFSHGLRSIVSTATTYVAAHGRESLGWLDQPVANYVLRKLQLFEEGPVGRRAITGERADSLDLANRTGFVHFWQAGSLVQRRIEMRRYAERLSEHVKCFQPNELVG